MSQVNLLPPDILAAQRQRRLAGVVALAGVGDGPILVFYVLQVGKLGGVGDIDQQEQTNASLQNQINSLGEFETSPPRPRRRSSS